MNKIFNKQRLDHVINIDIPISRTFLKINSSDKYDFRTDRRVI